MPTLKSLSCSTETFMVASIFSLVFVQFPRNYIPVKQELNFNWAAKAFFGGDGGGGLYTLKPPHNLVAEDCVT